MTWNWSAIVVSCCVYQALDSRGETLFRHEFRTRWDLPFVLFDSWLDFKIEIHPRKFQASLFLSSRSGKEMSAVIGMLQYLRFFTVLKRVHSKHCPSCPFLCILIHRCQQDRHIKNVHVQTCTLMHIAHVKMTLKLTKKQLSWDVFRQFASPGSTMFFALSLLRVSSAVKPGGLDRTACQESPVSKKIGTVDVGVFC